MKLQIDKHPTDPCGRIVATAESEEDIEKLDLLFQSILTRKHKEGRFTGSHTFEVFFQTDAEIGVDPNHPPKSTKP